MSESAGAPRPEAKEIFLEAIELPADQHAAFLERACGADAALRAAVESLLSAQDKAGDFLAGVTLQDSALPPESQRLIGPYKLLQVIGEGGFGTVYMAEQESPVRRRVALKIIKLGMDTKQVVARFEAERQALAMMDHPNIAKVFDAGATATGRPYFVMELVSGIPVTEYCDKNLLTPQQRIELFVPVCQAVQHAHQKGVIHRDLKPSNVLVTLHDSRPVPKIIDFGIAKATQSRLTEKTLFTEFRQMIGTPEYMSPEQAEMSGLDVDTRSDIYSLGVLLYELLTGTTPFDARDLRSKAYAEIQRVIREVEPPRPSTRLSAMRDTLPSVAAHRSVEPRKLNTLVRGELDWIVMKCLEKDRTRRYEAASALAEDLRRYLEYQPVIAGPPSATYRFRKFMRRHRTSVAIVALLTLLLLGGITGTTFGLIAARKQRNEAQRQRLAAEQANQNTQAVNRFLTEDLLTAATPEVAQGQTITVRQAVDRAAQNVGETFKDRPLIEASVRHTLALTYNSLGDIDLALTHAWAALAIRQRVLGDDHPDTIESLTIIGLLLQYQGNFSEAEPLYHQAVERSRSVLGNDNPETLRRIFDHASLLMDQGKFSEAESTFREVLAARTRVLGPDDPDTLSTMNYLARAMNEQGKIDEAEPLIRQVLQKRRQVLGESHPQTIMSINDLAGALGDRQQLEGAEQLYREALASYRRVMGDDHPSTLISMQNLAGVLLRRGKVGESESLYRAALEGSRRAQGEDNPLTIIVMMNLCELLTGSGKLPEAEAIGRDACQRCRNVYGPDHPYTLRANEFYSDALVAQKKYAEAEPLVAEMYRKAQTAQGDPRTNAWLQCKYALLLLKMERFDEAEKLLRDGYARMQATGRPADSRTRAALRGLVQLCQATGRAEEAAKLGAELAQLEAATRPASAPSSHP